MFQNVPNSVLHPFFDRLPTAASPCSPCWPAGPMPSIPRRPPDEAACITCSKQVADLVDQRQHVYPLHWVAVERPVERTHDLCQHASPEGREVPFYNLEDVTSTENPSTSRSSDGAKPKTASEYLAENPAQRAVRMLSSDMIRPPSVPTPKPHEVPGDHTALPWKHSPCKPPTWELELAPEAKRPPLAPQGRRVTSWSVGWLWHERHGELAKGQWFQFHSNQVVPNETLVPDVGHASKITLKVIHLIPLLRAVGVGGCSWLPDLSSSGPSEVRWHSNSRMSLKKDGSPSTRSKKLLGTSASLLVASALLLGARFATRNYFRGDCAIYSRSRLIL